MNREDLKLLTQAARNAGAIAREFFYVGNAKKWNKEENHPVTEADIAVNDYLLKTLMNARPDYGWLSEETKDDASRHIAERSFVIDPIDGTRAFIDGKPHFTVCAAVIENGSPVSGVIYNPITEEMFQAFLGGGTTLNGQPITPSGCSNIKNCNIIGYPRKFKRLGWPDMNVSIRNSMAYRIAMVAAGMRDATVSFTPKSDWDLAAAVIIADEAGAVSTDLTGVPFIFDQESTKNNGVICASPSLHALLLEQVNHGLTDYQNKGRSKKKLETSMSDHKEEKQIPDQLLHIVIGGELVDPLKTEFHDLSKVEFVGAFPSYESARKAWKNAAQRTVDNAHMRYFVLHAHHLIDPDNDGVIG
ncbi:MAG: inositol monophosphatase family protein [Robiginitomaculum sp.]